MEIGTIIGGLVVAILAFFGFNKLKNQSAKDDYLEILKTIDMQNRDKERNREVMEFEAEERLAAKEKLETELAREVSDEEIVDYLNDRYKSS